MELVVENWYYEDGLYCQIIDDKVVGKIKAEYMPDWYKVWQKKCLTAGVEIDSPMGIELKPNQTVRKLWEHKNADSNN